MTIWVLNMFRRNKINCSKIKNTLWLLFVGGFFIWPIFCFGASNDVVINEIAWMGTSENWRYEWIELYNNTDQNTSLDSWKIELCRDDLDFTIELLGTIEDYFLIVASDAIFANYDFNYSNLGGKFNNSGQKIVLKNSQEGIVDEIDCFSSGEGWFAGDNSTKQTMERTTDGWQTSLNPGGTPKALNSSGEEIPPGEEPPVEEPEDGGWIPPTVVNQPPIADAGLDITALVNREIFFDASQSFDSDNDSLIYFWNFGDGATDTEEKASHIYLYPGQYIVTLMVSDEEFSDLDIITVNIYSPSVIISEFMPNPLGEDEENEWIELFNQSDQIANLTSWQLDDQEDGSSPFIFPANSLIAPHQFLVLRSPITKISLNNDTDQVRLIYPDGSLATEVSYAGENEQGFSVAFDNLDYFWTKIPTPGSANIISSIGLENENKNISSNNPQPIIEQAQETPEILAKVNLSQSQEFSTLSEAGNLTPTKKETLNHNQSDQSVDEIAEGLIESPSQQAASLAQTSQSSQKANLILTLSIIISGSLLVSWFLIRLKKRMIK